MTTPPADQQPVDTGDLWRWVDRLTRPERTRVVRTPDVGPKTVEWVDVPSLYDLLGSMKGSSTSGGGSGKASGGSRAPLNIVVTSLLASIHTAVVDALVAHKEPLRYKPGAGRTADYGVRVLDIPSNLRLLAAVVVDTGDQDLVSWWTAQLRSWVTRAAAALQLDGDDTLVVRDVRGATCLDCGADHVLEERDGETFRVATIVYTFRDGQVLHRTCRACEAGWWTDADASEDDAAAAAAEPVEAPAPAPLAALIPTQRAAGSRLAALLELEAIG